MISNANHEIRRHTMQINVWSKRHPVWRRAQIINSESSPATCSRHASRDSSESNRPRQNRRQMDNLHSHRAVRHDLFRTPTATTIARQTTSKHVNFANCTGRQRPRWFRKKGKAKAINWSINNPPYTGCEGFRYLPPATGMSGKQYVYTTRLDCIYTVKGGKIRN